MTSGPHEGREFSFDRHDNFIVGRAKTAQFRLSKKDRYFSRNHFLIEVNPPLCRLLDLNSTNGTLVNGKKVSSIELHDGDTIKAGDRTLQANFVAFEGKGLASGPVSAPAPAESPHTAPSVLNDHTIVPRNWSRSASSSAQRPQEIEPAAAGHSEQIEKISAPLIPAHRPSPHGKKHRFGRLQACRSKIEPESPPSPNHLMAMKSSRKSDVAEWESYTELLTKRTEPSLP